MPRGSLRCRSDGVVVFVDPMTEKKKKNRVRHIKDGAPKRFRGIPMERRTNNLENS